MPDVVAGAIGFHGIENAVVAHEFVPLRQACRPLRGQHRLFDRAGRLNRYRGLVITGHIAAPVAKSETEGVSSVPTSMWDIQRAGYTKIRTE